MILFDYIYYRTYILYKESWNEDDPKLYSAAVVSLIQEFNVGVMILLLIYYFEIHVERFYFIIFYIFLFALNMFKYRKKRTFKKLYSKWRFETRNKKIYRGILIVAYILVSFFLFFTVAIFIGKNS